MDEGWLYPAIVLDLFNRKRIHSTHKTRKEW
jgi:hypothetical protein